MRSSSSFHTFIIGHPLFMKSIRIVVEEEETKVDRKKFRSHTKVFVLNKNA